MKIAVIVVRTLMGLLFSASSVFFFLGMVPEQELEGAMLTFNEGLKASVYLLPFIKITELAVGIAFLSGRYVALANIILAPVLLNILFVHIFLAPEGLPIAIVLVASSIFLAYAYKEKYKPLFESK
jgi:putative oxidoreductase